MARWHSCIVFDSKERHLWQFNASGNKVLREESIALAEPLPAQLVVKDWPNLFQPKLNVAWLPPEEVFLRIVQIPKSDAEETRSMLELQLEKLSPMPVNQALWGFEIVPQPSAEMQTAVVIIVARQRVEQFLGKLEEEKYLPDRLELPLIDQLRATEITGDGVWIYPTQSADHPSCLIAWWNGGTLCHLSLFELPPGGDQRQRLQDHLTQIGWAGEIEGWLTDDPQYHLVSPPELVDTWKPLLPEDPPVEVVPPVPADHLASLTARRAVAEDQRVNLLPREYSTRYKQQLTDRLAMRALMGLGLVYVLGVVVYLGWAQGVRWQHNRLEGQVAGLGASYTNTIRLRETVRVLQDQLDLRFAALEAWKAVAEELPTDLKLDSLNFQRGRTLSLLGSAPPGAAEEIILFNENLQAKKVEGQRLFNDVSAPRTGERQGQISWNFSAEMNRAEAE